MSYTDYYFIPCLREGLTAAISKGGTAGQRTEINVTLHAQARVIATDKYKPEPITKRVQLYGPGDVLGFHRRIVTRTDPVHNTGNFEPNYFPAIEFNEPDFAWRFTADKADDTHHSLTPWITLIVLIAEKGQEEFTDETSSIQSKASCIRVNPDFLPDLEYAWQWAHVQVTSEHGELSESGLKDIINNHPEQVICRLMSPRRLRPQTLYNAFVVPTFKLGMAASGIPGVVGDDLNANDKSWIKGSTGRITLPYYYKWEFRTSLRGDFEYLLRLLKTRKLPGLGTRDMNCEKPGYGISGINRAGIRSQDNHNLKLEGALQSIETKYTPWGNDRYESIITPETFQEEIAQKLLNKPTRDLGLLPEEQDSGRFTHSGISTSSINDITIRPGDDGISVRFTWTTAQESTLRIDYGLTSEYGNCEYRSRETDHELTLTGLVPNKQYFYKISGIRGIGIVEGTFDLPELPSVVPPIYGRWHRGKQTVDPQDPDKWINTLNLDPRHRAAAGLGTQVINKQQEALMASAWEQLGDLLRINRMLSKAQVGRDSGRNLHQRMDEMHLDQFLSYTAPVQKRVIMENPCAQDDNEQPKKISIDQFIKKNTRIPLGMMDPAFRSIARRRGPIRKRQKTAPSREDLLTRVFNGELEPAGPHPRPGGMFTPCMISHLLFERMTSPNIEYTLNVTATNGGTATVSPDNDSYSAGTIVTITALPNDNLDFLGWSGVPVNDLSDLSVSFEMHDNYDIVALFSSILIDPPVDDPPVDDPTGVSDTGGIIGLGPGSGLLSPSSPTPSLNPMGSSSLSRSTRIILSRLDSSHTTAAGIEGSIGHLGSILNGVIGTTSTSEGTRFCEDRIKDLDIAEHIEENDPFDGIDDLPDQAETAQAVKDALVNWLNKTPQSEDKNTYDTEFLEGIRRTLHLSLNPEHTVLERVKKRIRLSKTLKVSLEEDKGRDPLNGIRIEPEFPQPMYEPLRDLSQDHLLPGVETIPQNTLCLLKTNRRFLESYMVGCNHEFAGELLWRRYPTDQRGSYFRQFWDVSEYVPKSHEIDLSGKLKKEVKEHLRDIEKIHLWDDNKLSMNTTKSSIVDNREEDEDQDEDDNNIVLLIRGDLLKRYPNTVIYAVNAIDVSNQDNRISGPEVKRIIRPELEEFLDEYSDEYYEKYKEEPIERNLRKPIFPIFKGTLSPDLTFLGFPFDDETEARGDGKDEHGVYFIIEERVSETRFGLDLPKDDSMKSWDDLCWKKVNLGGDEDYNEYVDGELSVYKDPPDDNVLFKSDEKTWNPDSSSATRAWITMQKPVRIAVHASQMMPEPEGNGA